MRNLSDERGFITAWLVKLALSFVVVGILLFDIGSIAVNYFTLDSTADDIAVALIPTGQKLNPSQESAITERAGQLAAESDARLLSLSIDDGGIVRLQIRRRADTLVVERIGFMKDWARATAEGQAGSI